jgi:hypothetical protein
MAIMSKHVALIKTARDIAKLCAQFDAAARSLEQQVDEFEQRIGIAFAVDESRPSEQVRRENVAVLNRLVGEVDRRLA